MSGTAALIVLLVFTAIVMTAAGYRFRTERRPTISHENDDKIFRTAPRWAGRLNEKMDQVLAGQQRLHRHIGSEADADYERDVIIMASVQDVIAKATEAQTVSASTNIAVREVIRLLKESAADPAKLDEAVALLEAMRADDAAMLTDNTPAAPPA